jgi:hypothetical protein
VICEVPFLPRCCVQSGLCLGSGSFDVRVPEDLGIQLAGEPLALCLPSVDSDPLAVHRGSISGDDRGEQSPFAALAGLHVGVDSVRSVHPVRLSALLVYYDRAAPRARSTSSPSARSLDCTAHAEDSGQPSNREAAVPRAGSCGSVGHRARTVGHECGDAHLSRRGLSCVYIVPVIHVLAADMARVAWALRAAPDYCSLRLLIGLCALLVSMAVYLTAQEVPLLLANDGQSPRPKPAMFGHHAVSFFRGKASGLADGTFVMSIIVEKLSNSPCIYVVVVVPASTHHLITSEDEAGAVRAEVRRTYQLTEVGPGVTRLDVAARARPNKPCGGLRSARPCCAPPAFPTSARCLQLS